MVLCIRMTKEALLFALSVGFIQGNTHTPHIEQKKNCLGRYRITKNSFDEREITFKVV